MSPPNSKFPNVHPSKFDGIDAAAEFQPGLSQRIRILFLLFPTEATPGEIICQFPSGLERSQTAPIAGGVEIAIVCVVPLMIEAHPPVTLQTAKRATIAANRSITFPRDSRAITTNRRRTAREDYAKVVNLRFLWRRFPRINAARRMVDCKIRWGCSRMSARYGGSAAGDRPLEIVRRPSNDAADPDPSDHCATAERDAVRRGPASSSS